MEYYAIYDTEGAMYEHSKVNIYKTVSTFFLLRVCKQKSETLTWPPSFTFSDDVIIKYKQLSVR